MSSLGDTIVNDPQMNALATSLKAVNDQIASITGNITQLNTQISTLQNNVTLFTANNATLLSNLSARVTVLLGTGTSSADIVSDPQCFSYSASIGNNQVAIANMNNLVTQLQTNLAIVTQQQTDASAQATDLASQVSARMDVLRGL